jgi:hypothetical protein
MPTPTYDLLASTILTSAAASVTFSSLPSSGYRDLIIVVDYGRMFDGSRSVRIRFNSSSGTDHGWVEMYAQGSTPASQSATGQSYIDYGFYPGNIFHAIIQINDFAMTNKHKPVLARYNEPNSIVSATAGRYASTNAITNIELLTQASQYATGTRFHIYGITS